MHRFYVPPELCQAPAFALPRAETHHAVDVLRLRRGDAVTILDGAGAQLECVIKEAGSHSASVEVRQRIVAAKPAFDITLLQALPKGKIIESIIEKATELGVSRVVPVLSERVVSRLTEEEARDKASKWQAVAISAVKQCGAPWLPRIDTPISVTAQLARRDSFDLSLVGALQQDAMHPRHFFEAYLKTRETLPRTVAVWIGPEGDFTPAELDLIRSSGACPITLGPLVLRSETAAIYSLSIIRYELSAALEP